MNDLVYLTDPFIRTTDFVLDPEQKIDPFSCEAVEVEHPEGYVRHHLCGKPAHPVKVLIVRGPGAGRVGEVDWCEEHEKMFYAEQKDEYLN